MSPSHAPSIVVVGSLNRDVVVTARALPKPGETVLGADYSLHNGGKGANQAVALARLGQQVAMVGCVGKDEDGSALLESLEAEGVNVDSISRSATHTGVAVITVDAKGENSIVVVPGANGDLGGKAVDSSASTIAAADVVLAQLEVPIPTVARAFDHATGTVVLNPAPAVTLSKELLEAVDYLVPNRTELASLAGTEVPMTDERIVAAIESLEFAGVVVVTLGDEGALAVSRGAIVARATPPSVDVVDAVGAGDAFCAGLCDALSKNYPLQRAVEWAVVCGALATTRHGAQPSMPSASAVDEAIARQ